MVKAKDNTKRKFQTEIEARTYIINKLQNHFEITEEVSAKGPEGDDFRIDAICQCKKTGWFVGLEIKKSHLFKAEFAKAVRQAIYYRLSRVNDRRLTELVRGRLPTVALFPDWMGEHDEDDVSYSQEAEGMRLVGGQFRVSTLRENNYGNLVLLGGQVPIWSEQSGWTGNAKGWLYGKRSLGSNRRKDR